MINEAQFTVQLVEAVTPLYSQQVLEQKLQTVYTPASVHLLYLYAIDQQKFVKDRHGQEDDPIQIPWQVWSRFFPDWNSNLIISEPVGFQFSNPAQEPDPEAPR